MIAYDSTDSFYTFRLAQLYMRLDKTPEASLLLDELQYDEVYGQNVKTLLQTIDIEEEGDAYEYSIPLQRYSILILNNVLDRRDIYYDTPWSF